MGANKTRVDVGRLVDEQPIRAFHVKLVILLFFVLISDGFDLQAIGYAARAWSRSGISTARRSARSLPRA